MNDPCDSIATFKELVEWTDRGERYGFGELFCMWTNTVPAIALPGENWRAPDWLTHEQRGRRAVGHFDVVQLLPAGRSL